MTMDARDFAIGLAREAGGILMKHLGRARTVAQKGPIDFVTEADLESENFILEALHRRFPEHGILTEETKGKETRADYTWLVDPLDGTINFLHGYPHFAVTLALQKDKTIVLGVVYDPVRDEVFWAEKGKGAYLRDKRLSVSQTAELVASLITSGFPYDIATTSRTNLAEFSRLALAGQGPRCSGSAVLDLCYVAAGRLDGYWEAGVKPWDIAAGGLLVEEAGGMVTNYQGGRWWPFRGEIVASNGRIHPQLLSVLQNQGARDG